MTISTCKPRTDHPKLPLSLLALGAGALLLPGCGGTDDGEGTVQVTAYGEEFIEEGIPASEMDDDWSVEFERFEVTIGGVEVGNEGLEDAVTIDVSMPSDGQGHEVGILEVPAGDHDGSTYTVQRVDMAGSATRDGVTKSFHWVFDTPVRYSRCETTTSVADAEQATFQITIHADHFFYDSLVATSPQLLFSPLADADADDDGEITPRELAAADIGPYDPGNEDADDLWAFLVALNATLGHVDGEGHCDATIVDE